MSDDRIVGADRETRSKARRRRTRVRRGRHFTALLADAGTALERLRWAQEYQRAVAPHVPEKIVDQWVEDIIEAANGGNRA